MLRIAVCDDEKNMIEEICKIIAVYCKKKQIEHRIFPYFDGEDLLKSEERFDILFLDIEMERMDGIKAAEHIREQDMNVPIIYITGYADYWRRAFKVHAFGYITKPLKESELYNVMDDYFSSVHDANEETITLATDDGVACFKLNDVYYFMFEAKKKVYVCDLTSKIQKIDRQNAKKPPLNAKY